MRLLKHLLFTAALHVTFSALADGGHLPFLRMDDATPLRGTTSTTAHTRLHREDGRLMLEFQLPRLGEGVITLTDAQGRVLLREHVQGRGVQVRQLSAIPGRGELTMRIEQEGVTLLRKLVIEQA